MQLGDKYAKEGLIPVVVGVWIPNFVLLVIGLVLLRKASNDARLFENETYYVVFNKIQSFFLKLQKKKKTSVV